MTKFLKNTAEACMWLSLVLFIVTISQTENLRALYAMAALLMAWGVFIHYTQDALSERKLGRYRLHKAAYQVVFRLRKEGTKKPIKI